MSEEQNIPRKPGDKTPPANTPASQPAANSPAPTETKTPVNKAIPVETPTPNHKRQQWKYITRTTRRIKRNGTNTCWNF